MNDETKNETNFGYKKVNPKEKPDLVKGVFDSVSNSFLILSLNKDSSSLFIAFERESIGVRCATVSNPANGFAPTL